MKIDSICPKCGELSQVETNEGDLLSVSCPKGHVYEHPVTRYSRVEPMKPTDWQMVHERVLTRLHWHPTPATTVCHIVVSAGDGKPYEATGKATVKNLEDYKAVVGQDRAYEDALKKAFIALGGVLN